MKKSLVVLVHFAFWGVYFSLILIQEFTTYNLLASHASNYPNYPPFLSHFSFQKCFMLLLPTVSFYFGYFFLFKHYFKNSKFWKTFLLGLSFSIPMGIAGLIDLYSHSLPNMLIREESALIPIFVWSIMSIHYSLKNLIVVFAGFIMRIFINWFKTQKEKRVLREKNHQIELALVKAQLDPHFLFNTLNNIDSLIKKEPTKASIYLNQLSDIMRFMLFETKIEKIKLSKEVEYVLKYIDLQKIRSTNPNFVQFEIKGKIEDIIISPMLFIPFIENAFKHLSDNTLDGAVRVQLTVEHSKIHFNCKNYYNEEVQPLDEYNGLGRELIQKRLDLLYPKSHKLEVNQLNGIYTTDLTIETHEN